jgi:opacity protein-like surface antigen
MIRRLSIFLCVVSSFAWPAAASAQVTGGSSPYPSVAPRGFVMFSQQQFAATETFEAIFGEASGSFRGGGVDVVLARNVFVEFGVSRFERTGERVFRFSGETFKLGIPLTISLRPVEIAGGYRLTVWRSVVPYGGMGMASYRYEESSDFAAAGDDVSVSKSGLVLIGGAEVRLARLVGVSADLHYSQLEDVIGKGGISKDFGETDLGGTAIRFRIIIGR